MAANNEIGTIQPIKQIAELAHSVGAKFHTDAVQAVGHMHIDVQEMGIDCCPCPVISSAVRAAPACCM